MHTTCMVPASWSVAWLSLSETLLSLELCLWLVPRTKADESDRDRHFNQQAERSGSKDSAVYTDLSTTSCHMAMHVAQYAGNGNVSPPVPQVVVFPLSSCCFMMQMSSYISSSKPCVGYEDHVTTTVLWFTLYSHPYSGRGSKQVKRWMTGFPSQNAKSLNFFPSLLHSKRWSKVEDIQAHTTVREVIKEGITALLKFITRVIKCTCCTQSALRTSSFVDQNLFHQPAKSSAHPQSHKMVCLYSREGRRGGQYCRGAYLLHSTLRELLGM